MYQVLLAATASLAVISVVVAVKAHVDLRLYRLRFKWADEDLDEARRDSLSRSRSAVTGKVQEHLAPLFPQFCAEFNARDARFLGSPVDFVVFDGLDAGELARIVFIEVKTGRSGLSLRERQIRDTVELCKVEWRELRL
jgi:predicted Holliday junction resolvase-like endonuclease